MSEGYEEIARVLERARVRNRRIVARAALLRALAKGLACLFGGSLGVAVGAGVGFSRVATLLGVAVAFGMEGWKALRAIRATRDPAAVGRAITAADGPLRSALLSAVELGRDRDAIASSGRFSLALIDGHLARSARDVAGVDLDRALPAQPVRQAGKALAAVAGVTLVALLFGSGSFRPALRRILSGDPATARPALEPITGDVELTLRYPAYMQRQPRTVSGTGGEVRAPKGTEVSLKTRADRPVKGAEVEIEQAPGRGEEAGSPAGERRDSRRASEPGKTRAPLAVTGERDLAGKFTVQGGGTYRFRFLDGRGRAVAEGPPIPIVVEADAFPEVRVLS
ncbi:MAG TPA: hypothetical protein VLT61_17905, partial [Anaeromyxobacteraceae bacterium]|nr:hypothetical protein [Anaeromyxobacteraceae bacterium]